MLKIGLIGCGFMGSMHANCYQNIAGVKVTAVADLRREKAEALAELAGSAELRKNYSEKQRRLVDGCGASRIAEALRDLAAEVKNR